MTEHDQAPDTNAEETATPVISTTAPAARPAAKTAPAPRVASTVAGGWSLGTGRRKAAVARVRLRPGDGKFIVNKRPHTEYFTEERDRNDLVNVLEKTGVVKALDIHVNVNGGGFTGQAGAIILGLARALRAYDPNLEPILRSNDFLTRDPRRVERKKYGQPGARKRFQFSKR